MDSFKEQALREIDALRESIEQYKRGELTPEQFRPRRLAYGVYAQLAHTSNMLRLKLPAGVVTAEQLEAIAEVAERYGRSLAHVTTRQDIQFHWVPLEAAPDIFTRLLDVGIVNRGACSDSIRNVTACHMAGLCPNQEFDVLPYALAVSDYFLFHPLNLTLPRKFKISVSGCAADCALGKIHDIGIVAASRNDNGSRVEGFKVMAGGGLGSLPHLAETIREFVPRDDILIVCEALVRVFHRYGERKNRLRARMKFLLKKRGFEEFRGLVNEEYAKIEKDQGDQLRGKLSELVASHKQPPPQRTPSAVGDNGAADDGEGYEHWLKTNVMRQRQEGYNAAIVKLPLGDATSDQLRALAQTCRELGNGTVRTTVSQNIAVPWITDADLPEFYSRLVDIGLAEPDAHHITDVVSCPGADYCSLAITKSMGVGARVREHLAGGQTDVDRLGRFRIQISGCPNSCGQHHIGDIGLTGLMVKGKDGVERPHYSILVGGGVTGENPTLAHRISGRYPEEDTPRIIAAFAQYYLDNRKDGEGFREFVQRMGVERFSQMARSIAHEKYLNNNADPEMDAID